MLFQPKQVLALTGLMVLSVGKSFPVGAVRLSSERGKVSKEIVVRKIYRRKKKSYLLRLIA